MNRGGAIKLSNPTSNKNRASLNTLRDALDIYDICFASATFYLDSDVVLSESNASFQNN